MLQPMPGHVYVLTDVPRTQTASGLHLVKDWDPEMTGQVVAVGAGTRCARCGRDGHDPSVAVGERVLFPKTRGTRFAFEGTEYLSLKFDDVLAVFDDDEVAKETAHA